MSELPRWGLYSASLLFRGHPEFQRNLNQPIQFYRGPSSWLNTQDIEELGYAYRPSISRGPDGTPLWEVVAGSRVDHIALLGYDVPGGIVTVYEAWTRDRDEVKSLNLRDLIVSFWKQKAGQDLGALRVIKYSSVLEETTRPLIKGIYEVMGSWFGLPLTISARGTKPGERVAYLALLRQGPFGNGAQGMLAEYAGFSGKSIKAFEEGP